jgi:hypothetical protein
MLLCEVTSVEKDCKVLLNMDLVIEIAPLKSGQTAIFYSDNAAVNGKTAIQVKESYEMFKQFAVHTVSSDDIAKKIATMRSSTVERMELPPQLSTPIQQVNDQITDSVTQVAKAPSVTERLQADGRRMPGRKKPGRKPGQVYVKKEIIQNGDETNG